MTPEDAARQVPDDITGHWEDVLHEPYQIGRHWKLLAFNMPVAAVIGAGVHAGYADRFIVDPILGAWIGGIGLVFLWALGALLAGRDDLSAWVGKRLTLLGMLGTLHGFVIAFAAVATAGDLATTKVAIGALTHGLSVALYTSIAGLVCKMWLDVLARWAR